MSQLVTSKVAVESVVPDFTLPTIEGGAVSPHEYKQRANLVIAYLDLDRCGQCADLLTSFADRLNDYRDLEAQIVVVFAQSIEELKGKAGTLGLSFPVASDVDRKMARSYFGEERPPMAAVFITDRFGALKAQYLCESDDDLPDQNAILDWLNLIEMECPECGT